MNRIYKVIWNEALNCFTAVGEYAKTRGKSSKSSVSANASINTTSNLSSTRFFRLSTIGIGLIAAGLTMSPQVFSATGVNGAVATGVTSCGTSAIAGKTDSVAVGCDSVADLSSDPNIYFYDRENPDNKPPIVDTNTDFNSTAIGTGAKAREAGTSLGMHASSRNLGVALGIQAKSDNVAALAIGPAALAKGNTSLALGRQSAAIADFAQAIGNVASATGTGSLAVGHSARAEGYRSIAIGSADIANAGKKGDQEGVTYQINQQTLAEGEDSIALGSGAESLKEDSVALGSYSTANVAGGITGYDPTGNNNAAITATKSTTGAVSVGRSASNEKAAVRRQIVNVAAGTNNSDAVNVSQLKGLAGLELDFDGDTGNTVSRKLGEKLTVKGGAATALSSGNIGVVADDSDNTLTVKLAKDLTNMNNITFLGGSTVSLSGNGLNNGGNQITGVASGGSLTDPNDQNNAANIGDLNDAVSNNKTKYYSVKSMGGSNDDNQGATGVNAMAMGRNASATGSQGIAIGSVGGGSAQRTLASGEQSIAIGANVVSSGNSSIAIGGDDLDAASADAGAIFTAYTGSSLVETPPYMVNTESDGAASIAIGAKALSKGDLSTAVGVRSSSSGQASSAFGMGSSASKDGSVALGAGSTTLNDATYQEKLTIGNKDYFYAGATNDKGAQVSVGSEERERQIKHVASGEVSKTSTDGINGSQLHATNESVKDLSDVVVSNKTHFYSVNSTDSTRGNYNNNGATGVDAMAAGIDASAEGENATALGTNSNAEGTRSTAIGYKAQAKDRNAIALGYKANASNKHSTAIGYAANAGYAAIAIGDAATATKKGSTAIGSKSVSTGEYSTALGRAAKALKKNTVALGYNTTASGDSSVAIGDGSKANGVNSIAIGTGNIVNGDNSGAFGDPNIINGTGSYAVGNNNIIDADNAFVVGNNVTVAAGLDGAVGIGNNSTVTASTVTSFVPTGATSVVGTATGSNVVSVGSADNERRLTNVAAGGADTDAVNVSQLKQLNNTVVANKTHFYSVNNTDPTAGNYNNNGATGNNAMAAGVNANAVGLDATAVGSASNAEGKWSTAVGFNGKAKGRSSVALGHQANANHNNAAAVGYGASAGYASTAIGERSKAEKKGSTAIGSQSEAIGVYSTALGREAKAVGNNSIALGHGATASGNGNAFAGRDTAAIALGLNSTASAKDSMALGQDAEATGDDSIAMGHGAIASGKQSISVGTGNVVSGDNSGAFGDPNIISGTGSYAVGNNNNIANNNTFVLGNDVETTQDNSIILGNASSDRAATTETGITINGTNYSYAGQGSATNGVMSVGFVGGERQIINVAAGEVSATSTDAINGSQLHATNEAISDIDFPIRSSNVQPYTTSVTGTNALAVGSNAIANGDRSTSVGENAKAIGIQASAFGSGAEATARSSLASGFEAKAKGGESVALGVKSNAEGLGATAVGPTANARGENSAALGRRSKADGSGAMALGGFSQAKSENATAVGFEAEATAVEASAFGHKAKAAMEGATAIGTNAFAKAIDATAVGNKAQAGRNSIALGMNANALNSGTVALGTQSFAGQGATVVGTNAKASGKDSTALGRFSEANDTDSVALGSFSKTAAAIGTSGIVLANGTYTFAGVVPKGTVSVGSVGAERTVTNVAAGRISATSTDAINGSQLHATNEAIGNLSGTVIANKTKYYSVSSGATGLNSNENNDGAKAPNAMAMGGNALATGGQAIAIGSSESGQNTVASGQQSIAIGANVVSSGDSSIAIGGDDLDAASKANIDGTSASGINGGDVNATFFSYTGRDLVETPPYMVNTESGGAASIVMGAKALSKGNLSTAVGVRSSSSGQASSAFGMGSSAVAEGSVALGAGSVANVAGGAMGYDPTGSSDAAIKATQSGARYGAVSVGNGAEGGNRQIVNVAAGTNNSDAVNVSQLKGLAGLELDFDGDTGNTVSRKLGEKLTVKGGATNLSDNNIGVVANDTNKTLTVKLAKDLTGLDSVTTGNTVMSNNDGVTFLGGSSVQLSDAGLHNGGNQITGVASGGSLTDLNDQNNAANIGDLNNAIGDVTTLGFGIKAADNNTVQKNLGQTVDIIGSNGNITTQVDSGKVEVVLNNNLDLGNNGTVTTGNVLSGTNVNRLGMVTGGLLTGGVTTVSGAGVTVTGLNPFNPSSAALTSNGLTILNGPSITKSGGVNAGNKKVVNVDDGLIGLNSKDAINGGQLYETNNEIAKGIKFNVNDASSGGTLKRTFALGEEIKLNTDSNLTTTPLSTGDGIELGLAPVVNVGTDNPVQINGDTGTISGLTNRTFDPTITYTGGQAATQEQLSDLSGTIIDLGFEITADNASLAPGETKDKVKLGDTVKYTSADGSIVTTVADNEIDFALGDNLNVGGAGQDGEDGVDGFIGVNGADGASGVAINGADGTIGLTGPAGAGTIGVINGVPGVNGEDGITRIVIDDIQVATMEDGMKFAGNRGATIAKQLNETLNIEGTLADSADASGANLRVDSDGSKLNLVMAKNLTDLESITINNGGPIISSTGIDMGSNVDEEGYPTNTITNLGKGVNGTDAVNLDQLNDVTTDLTDLGFDITADNASLAPGETKDKVKLGDTVKYTSADGSIVTTVADNEIDFALGDNLSVGGPGLDGEDGVDGFIGVNGADGASGVAINGADGTIGLTGPAGIDGVSPTLTMRPEIQSGDVFDDDTDVTRLSYEDGDGNSHTIATLEDDGLRFSGNDNPTVGYVTRNLNKEMQIVGSKTAIGTYSSGNINTIATQDGGIEIQMADSPKFGEVIINAEDTGKITGLTAGEDDTDAVNVYQLNQTNATINQGLDFGGDSGTDVNRKLGQKLIVKGDDTINADPATKNISVTADGDDTLNIRLDKDINLGNTGSVTTGNTQVNNAGVTLYNGDNDQVALTNNGLNNGNNKITNVADGLLDASSKDAVNGSQLFKTNQDIAKGIKIGDGNSVNDQQFALGETINVTGDSNLTTVASATGVQVKLNNQLDLGDDGSIQIGNSIMSDAGFTFVGNGVNRMVSQVSLSSRGLDNGGNTIRNVGEGVLNTDAVNVGQLKDVAIALDQGWGITAQGDIATMVKQGDAVDLSSKDGNIKVTRTLVNGGLARQAGRAAGANDISFDLNRDIAVDSLQTGDSTLTSDGLTIAGGPSVTKSGINAADTKITNVVNGDVSESSQDAINGGQLYAQGSGISSIIGGDTVYNPVDGSFTNNNIGGTGENSIDGAIASIKRGEIIINENIQTNTTNIESNTTKIDANAADIMTNTTNIETNTTNIKVNKDKIDAGLNFGADSGANINKPVGDDSVLSFKGGNNITTTAQGSSITFDLNGNINMDSVTTGNTVINNSGVTIQDGPSMTAAGIYTGDSETAPSMTTDGINAAGTKVTNVADGMAPRDAVNFGQLDAVTRGLGDSINELGYRVDDVEDEANAGISAAMAMSSIPQSFLPGKSLVGGGVATYNGESAVAIGLSKVSDDGRWIMKISGTADTQGNAGGAIGAGFHF
ncbi:YadA-like family protein [uncultured Psychrobacter sp.]|uniref:ESPR-type extended signal peptide-containing protein n=1 Tax=uncultured Psychrobacter sp. TaxID=259303 RepID=UPI00260E0A87|nr:YadA-like family protein [uncultured Psychrobacter sp.]